jgi:hypothetical protein
VRLGGGDDGGAAPEDEGEEVEASDGEAVYEVLAATFAAMDDGQKLRLMGAFQEGKPFDRLDDDIQDLFEGAGEVLFTDEEDGENE